jgi:YggT family protein
MSFYFIKIVISILFDVISFAIIIRILLSWINIDKSHSLIKFIEDISAPILDIARKITPKLGVLDLSPLIAIIGLDLIKALILTLLP